VFDNNNSHSCFIHTVLKKPMMFGQVNQVFMYINKNLATIDQLEINANFMLTIIYMEIEHIIKFNLNDLVFRLITNKT